MKTRFMHIALAAGILLFPGHAIAAQAGDTYEKAVEYYNIGRYADVLRIIVPMAEHGNIPAQVLLGRCYENGLGVEQNNAEAVKWFASAAQQGDAEAQTQLGFAYETGVGVSQDLATAASWYLKAANSGRAEAQYKLGLMYHEGRGVEEDKTKAAPLFMAAAQQGDPDAELMLSAYYRYGLGGIPKDEALAEQWAQKAAQKGLQYSKHIFEK